MHRLLRLQHHRHTGKVLAHRHTSYRALAIILVLAGGLIAGAQWTLQKAASADTLFVLATVPAPIPPTAPTIDDPVDGFTTKDPSLDVSGTCPVISPAVSVVIYSNTVLKGSAPCQPDGTYSASITLDAGQNSLVAKAITITNGIGPDSNTVHVTYNAPPVPSGGSGTTPSNTGSPESKPATPKGTTDTTSEPGAPLVITADDAFVIFGPGRKAIWSGSFNGGQAPYTVTIDWGDGDVDVYKNVNSSQQQYAHTYTDMQPHTIRITVKDRNGSEASATFAAMSPYIVPQSSGLLQGGGMLGGSGSESPSTLIGIYGGYLFTLGVVGALWLHAHAAGYAYASIQSTRAGTARSGSRAGTRSRKR